MNIEEAKQEIKNTFLAYHARDERGRCRYPQVRQRPLLLMGPPGIGKTAIMEEIAAECHTGFLSYALTHHTRQSAIGLPHIEERCFAGERMHVTEYSMSEILASVYEYMERSGLEEGILFLDEINCVSETLAPAMLELLQNKRFGSHPLPPGWMIVAAGNPPEYNKSVRDFDVATLDRLRLIPVEPDCGVWLDYARARGLHGAVLSYLGLRPESFCRMTEDETGRHFVTPRGWEDLSRLLQSYEELGLPAGKAQVSQFLQEESTAAGFAAYYALYRKYDEDYGLAPLLRGELRGERRAAKAAMARAGSFEERFTVTELLLEGLEGPAGRWREKREDVKALHARLAELREHWNGGPAALAERLQKSLAVRRPRGLLSAEELSREEWVIERLEAFGLSLRKEHITEPEAGMERLRSLFAPERAELERLGEAAGTAIEEAFRFAEEAFGGESQELLLLVTGLSRSRNAMEYVIRRGSPAFLRHGAALSFRGEEVRLSAEVKSLLEE